MQQHHPAHATLYGLRLRCCSLGHRRPLKALTVTCWVTVTILLTLCQLMAARITTATTGGLKGFWWLGCGSGRQSANSHMGGISRRCWWSSEAELWKPTLEHIDWHDFDSHSREKLTKLLDGGLAINISRVQIPAAMLLSATLGKLFTHTCLCHQTVSVWYLPEKVSVGLASQWPCITRQQWNFHLRAHDLGKGHEHPAYVHLKYGTLLIFGGCSNPWKYSPIKMDMPNSEC